MSDIFFGGGGGGPGNLEIPLATTFCPPGLGARSNGFGPMHPRTCMVPVAL